MTSATQKIIAYHLRRLKDKRPEIRLESINELQEIGDPSVLEVLEEVYKTDTDADVRAAALNAGKVLFKHKVSSNTLI